MALMWGLQNAGSFNSSQKEKHTQKANIHSFLFSDGEPGLTRPRQHSGIISGPSDGHSLCESVCWGPAHSKPPPITQTGPPRGPS